MTIKAIHSIKASGVRYKPGDIISGLSSADEHMLVEQKAAVYYSEEPKEKVIDAVAFFESVLRKMTKLDILSYADKAEIQVQEGTKDAIISVIMEYVKTKGIDVDAFSLQHLKKFADAVGVPYTEETKKEELADLVTAKFN